MALRDVMLGDPKGKTAWQRLRDSWSEGRARDGWLRAFAKAYNPLGLQPGDLVELGFLDQTGFEVEMVLWFQTAAGDPNYVRYGLKRLESNDVALLEVMPGVGDEPRTCSLFELVDDFVLDDRLLAVLDEEEVLQRTIADGDGSEVELEFEKEFVSDARVSIFGAEDQHRDVRVFTYNYFRGDEQGEQYLTVEVVEEAEWMNFYLGRRVAETDILALGTATPAAG